MLNFYRNNSKKKNLKIKKIEILVRNFNIYIKFIHEEEARVMREKNNSSH